MRVRGHCAGQKNAIGQTYGHSAGQKNAIGRWTLVWPWHRITLFRRHKKQKPGARGGECPFTICVSSRTAAMATEKKKKKIGRPRKYHTEKEARLAINASNRASQKRRWAKLLRSHVTKEPEVTSPQFILDPRCSKVPPRPGGFTTQKKNAEKQTPHTPTPPQSTRADGERVIDSPVKPGREQQKLTEVNHMYRSKIHVLIQF